MALLTSYGEANKETLAGLNKVYTYEAKWIPSFGGMAYHYIRRCTKDYSYVGMDLGTAKACQEAKKQQYTRTIKGWFWEPEQDPPFAPRNMTTIGAEVTVSNTAGDMWECRIQVNENEDVWSTSLVADIPSLFSETGRDYDEGPSGSDE